MLRLCARGLIARARGPATRARGIAWSAVTRLAGSAPPPPADPMFKPLGHDDVDRTDGVMEGWQPETSPLALSWVPHVVMKEIYRKHMQDPTFWSARRIARVYRMHPDRAQAIIILMEREDMLRRKGVKLPRNVHTYMDRCIMADMMASAGAGMPTEFVETLESDTFERTVKPTYVPDAVDLQEFQGRLKQRLHREHRAKNRSVSSADYEQRIMRATNEIPEELDVDGAGYVPKATQPRQRTTPPVERQPSASRFALRDTSHSGTATVIREQDGRMRPASVKEEIQRSWNENPGGLAQLRAGMFTDPSVPTAEEMRTALEDVDADKDFSFPPVENVGPPSANEDTSRSSEVRRAAAWRARFDDFEQDEEEDGAWWLPHSDVREDAPTVPLPWGLRLVRDAMHELATKVLEFVRDPEATNPLEFYVWLTKWEPDVFRVMLSEERQMALSNEVVSNEWMPLQRGLQQKYSSPLTDWQYEPGGPRENEKRLQLVALGRWAMDFLRQEELQQQEENKGLRAKLPGGILPEELDAQTVPGAFAQAARALPANAVDRPQLFAGLASGLLEEPSRDLWGMDPSPWDDRIRECLRRGGAHVSNPFADDVDPERDSALLQINHDVQGQQHAHDQSSVNENGDTTAVSAAAAAAGLQTVGMEHVREFLAEVEAKWEQQREIRAERQWEPVVGTTWSEAFPRQVRDWHGFVTSVNTVIPQIHVENTLEQRARNAVANTSASSSSSSSTTSSCEHVRPHGIVLDDEQEARARAVTAVQEPDEHIADPAAQDMSAWRARVLQMARDEGDMFGRVIDADPSWLAQRYGRSQTLFSKVIPDDKWLKELEERRTQLRESSEHAHRLDDKLYVLLPHLSLEEEIALNAFARTVLPDELATKTVGDPDGNLRLRQQRIQLLSHVTGRQLATPDDISAPTVDLEHALTTFDSFDEMMASVSDEERTVLRKALREKVWQEAQFRVLSQRGNDYYGSIVPITDETPHPFAYRRRHSRKVSAARSEEHQW